MRIDKVEWIAAHNCGKLKMEFVLKMCRLSWKGKFWGHDIASQNVP